MKRFEEGLKRSNDERQAADKVIGAELQKTRKQIEDIEKRPKSP